jgi:archaellum biogenesis ATPase FlaH
MNAPTPTQLQPDLELALYFVRDLTGSEDSILTFQIIPEADGATAPPAILHGTLREVCDRLAAANRAGAGVFFAINELDGRGRRTENAVALRALVADDDEGGVDLFALSPEPSLVVATSPGKQHVYWLLKPGEPLAAFSPAQRAIAAKLGTDPSIHDLPRVLRLPGFLHQKGGKAPTLVTYEAWDRDRRHTVDDVLAAMGAVPLPPAQPDPPRTSDAAACDIDLGVLTRAREYLRTIRAIEGERGDNATFKAAAALLYDFSLPREMAWELLREWNQTNAEPSWSDAELGKKLMNAEKHGKHAPGAALMGDAPAYAAATPGISRFAFTSLEDVAEEEQTFLWDGFLPDGAFSIIEGNPDAGKTFMALDLAARISTGRALPDGDVNDVLPRQKVLFLTAEDSLGKTIKPRLIGCGADLSNIISQQSQGDALLLPGCLAALRSAIREYGIKLVVLDALNNYLDASKVKVNNEQEVRQALKPVRDLAAEENVGIIGLRHLNKKVEAGAFYRGGGSIALMAVARSVLLVARHPDDPDLRIVIPQKANLVADDKKAPVGFRIVSTHSSPDGKARPRIAWERDIAAINADELLAPRKPGPSPDVAAHAERVLRDVLANGPRNRKDVMEAGCAAGVNEKAIERAAATLGVVREPDGRERVWRFPGDLERPVQRAA